MNGEVEIAQVLNTGKFDFERAQAAPAGLKKCVESTCQKLRNLASPVSAMSLAAPSILKNSSNVSTGSMTSESSFDQKVFSG